jgi:hypothetical protein
VPHAERAYGAATTTAYCYDAVTVLPRCRNNINLSIKGESDITSEGRDDDNNNNIERQISENVQVSI